MSQIHDLLLLAEAYGITLGVEEKTVSSRVFSDSKKLAALRGGSDITVSRFNATIQWFSDNWPDGAAWPVGVQRPDKAQTIEAAE
jgi:hypothetical protein